jgi:hypothetical protein
MERPYKSQKFKGFKLFKWILYLCPCPLKFLVENLLNRAIAIQQVFIVNLPE